MNRRIALMLTGAVAAAALLVVRVRRTVEVIQKNVAPLNLIAPGCD